MTKTTHPPRLNVLEAAPELASMAAMTIRLHPRRGDVPALDASKIAGTFLWPEDEPWPTMPSEKPTWYPDSEYGDWQWNFPDGTPITLVPAIQINAKDVPEFPFPPGKDLLQILWQPLDVDQPPYHCVPRVFWRDSRAIKHPLTSMPPSPYANPGYVPKPCTLTFERVMEYPDVFELDPDLVERVNAWIEPQTVVFEDDPCDYLSKETLFQYELSVCPSNKLGGHVNWIQDPQWPTCDVCGRRMEHLLTLTDMDVDGGSWPRWLPMEDRQLWKDPWKHAEIVNAPDWYLGGGSMYYLVCRHCDDWPVKPVFQR
jgi:hypothetical protein